MNRLRAFVSVLGSLSLFSSCARDQPRPIDPVSTAAELESRSLDDPDLVAFLALNLHRDPGAGAPSTWNFEALTLAALYWHPSLDVARAEWASARSGETTAGARPNPTVSAGPEYNFNPASGVTPWIGNFSLDWPIETAGKRTKRIARSQSLSEAARLRLAVAAWKVRGQLRAALIELGSARRREQLLAARIALEEQIVARFEAKILAGAATRIEAAPSRIALERSRIEAADTKRRAAEALPRIAEAIGVPVRALANKELQFDLSPPDGTDLESAALRRAALTGRADVLAALADYAAAEALLRLEIARQYPDIHLGTGYQYDQGENKWSVGLGAEIPLLNRNEGPIAEAIAKRSESAARFLATQSNVIAEIDIAHASWGAAREHLLGLAPYRDSQRRQADAVEAMLRAGAAEQLDVLSAQAELAGGAVVELDAQVRAAQALGQLEDALQRPFTALETIERDRVSKAPAENLP
jgi:cobalt-zinc-cadmium efflux system outer membrane protein